jgi:ABC-type glutathione transport system ATPase component
MLEVKDLTIEYDHTTTVKDISFTVKSGEVYSIIGKSGCGKSTILNAISGMLGRNGRITGGTISLSGKMIFENGKYTPYLKEVLGKQLAAISQHPDGSFDPLFTIGNQMTEVMRVNEKISKKDAKIKGMEILSRLNFSDPERVWNSYPHELSGGMCQRVAVAMALSNKATLLLADEPTSALDVTSQAEFIRQLKEIVENDNLAVLLVTHNMAVAKALAGRAGYLRNGELSEDGGDAFAVTAG